MKELCESIEIAPASRIVQKNAVKPSHVLVESSHNESDIYHCEQCAYAGNVENERCR